MGEYYAACTLGLEDVLAYELRDIGLKFDGFMMTSLLDSFDANKDGMIPIGDFLGAVLA